MGGVVSVPEASTSNPKSSASFTSSSYIMMAISTPRADMLRRGEFVNEMAAHNSIIILYNNISILYRPLTVQCAVAYVLVVAL